VKNNQNTASSILPMRAVATNDSATNDSATNDSATNDSATNDSATSDFAASDSIGPSDQKSLQ
jgi:hypothetical protein